MNRKVILSVISALMVLSMILSACAAPTPPPAPKPTEAPKAAAPAATTAPAATKAPAMPYGLKPGKPYAGTKIVWLFSPATQWEAIKQRVGQFTELTGIEVEFAPIPYANLLDKITTEAVGGTGAYDAIWFTDSWGPSLAQYFVPLNDRIKADGLDMNRYPKAYQESGAFKGQQIALPIRGHPQLLFYRKDILEKAGVKPPTTWKELEEASKIIKEKTGLYGISTFYAKGSGLQNLWVWLTYLWSNGGDIFDEKWRPIFNNAAGVEATQRYTDLLKKGYAPPGAVTATEYDGSNSVMQGESAMVITWWWHISNLTNAKTAKPEVVSNIAFAPVPGWEGKGSATYTTVGVIGMFKSSKKQDATWEFLKWATNPDLEKAWALDKSKPETTTNVVVHKANLVDPEINKAWDNMQAAASKSLEVAKILPRLAEWPQVGSVLEIAINDIASGKPTKETLDKAAAEVTSIMERAGYYK
jgi:multiple sugar transport system substrate-binding protein